MNPLKIGWKIVRRGRLRSYLQPAARDYSQLGEQRVLENILDRMAHLKLNRVYLDIGAFHPTRGSNTFRLYQRGWKGVVVDPNPSKIRAFRNLRKDDLCLAKAVVPDSWPSESVTMVAAHSEDARESIDPSLNAKHRLDGTSISYPAEVIRITKLLELCRERLGLPTVLNLDIEGMEWEIVREIDFRKFPIPLLCIEHFLSDFDGGLSATQYARSPLVRKLEEQGYYLVSICGISLIFAHSETYVPFA